MAQEQNTESSKKRLLIIGAVALVLVAGAVAYWLHSRGFESTDDAFIQADVTLVAAKVAGTVIAVHVEDNQLVKAGTALFEIDPVDYETRLRQAEANLSAAQAQLLTAQADVEVTRKSTSSGMAQAKAAVAAAQAQSERAQSDADRYATLYAKDEVSKQMLDQVQTTARALKAQADQANAALRGTYSQPQQIAAKEAMVATAEAGVGQAQAAVDQARLQLSYTKVVAPAAGRVARKNIFVGSQVALGAPALAVVGNQPWVVANFKETQLRHMRVGQPVKIEVDAYPGHDFTGRIQSLQAGTGSAFSLLPPENATGNYVKVVQRVPVKVVFDPAPPANLHLGPGMSVEPIVDTSNDTAGQPLRSMQK